MLIFHLWDNHGVFIFLGGGGCEIFETACCFTWLIPSCLQISTDGSPNPMRWGQKEPVPVLHPGWLYIQMGSCMSHFNVSLTVGDVIKRWWPGVTTVEEEGKPKGSQTKILSNFQLSDLPLRPGWLTVHDRSPSRAFFYLPSRFRNHQPLLQFAQFTIFGVNQLNICSCCLCACTATVLHQNSGNSPREIMGCLNSRLF